MHFGVIYVNNVDIFRKKSQDSISKLSWKNKYVLPILPNYKHLISFVFVQKLKYRVGNKK